MDSYGDGNVYRGQVCKDPKIKTIEIRKCCVSKILKPCPFCGDKTELRERWGDCSKGPDWYEVECLNKNCGLCQDTADEAISAWNTRSAADVERLVEAARKIELNWATIGWGYNPELRDKLKAALEPFKEWARRGADGKTP